MILIMSGADTLEGRYDNSPYPTPFSSQPLVPPPKYTPILRFLRKE